MLVLLHHTSNQYFLEVLANSNFLSIRFCSLHFHKNGLVLSPIFTLLCCYVKAARRRMDAACFLIIVSLHNVYIELWKGVKVPQ
jgi:hypothetical protein